jgi:hypothetical protein
VRLNLKKKKGRSGSLGIQKGLGESQVGVPWCGKYTCTAMGS